MIFLSRVVDLVSGEQDTEDEIFRKKFLLAAIGVATLMCGVPFIRSWGDLMNTTMYYLFIGCGMVHVGNILVLGHLVRVKRVTNHAVVFLTSVYMIAVLVVEFENKIAHYPVVWPILFPVLHMHFVLCIAKSVSNVMVFGFMSFQLVTVLEEYLRFGFFDIPLTPTHQDRVRICDCSNPPCAATLNLTATTFVVPTMTLVIDYYFKYILRERLQRDEARIEASITTANTIAASLAAFDLDTAEEHLASSIIPSELHDAFDTLLQNLKQYRPYLPEALFTKRASIATKIHAPGVATGVAAVAFTDILSSTATWEACPEGMKKALRVHDKAIRLCIGAYNGYEVKTIGDAFMVAFEAAVDAMKFGLSVQEELVHASWPAELLQLEHLAWDASGPWCGLRVRIGVHWGEVEVQLNTLTGRYDYYGNTVNKAARLESACVGGAVAFLQDIICDNEPEKDLGEALREFGPVVVIQMGMTELKGVGMLTPVMVLPHGLRGRREYCEGQLLLKREDRRLDVGKSSTVASVLSTSLKGCEMVRTIGSVALVEVAYGALEDVCRFMNDVLTRVLLCSERCDGVLTSLQANHVTIGWNTSCKCISHVENSSRFVAVLHKSMSELTARHSLQSDIAHMGLSNGEIMHGTVGGTRQRFVSILGNCVEFLYVLCAEAVRTDTFCVYGPILNSSEFVCFLALDEVYFKGRHITVYDCLALVTDHDIDAEDAMSFASYSHRLQRQSTQST